MAAPAAAAAAGAASQSAPAASASAGTSGGQLLQFRGGGSQGDDDNGNGSKLAGALLAGLCVLVVVIALPALIVTAILPGGGDTPGIDAGAIPAAAQPYVPIYEDAAKVYKVSPFLLMAVHEDESTYSTCDAAGCPKHHGSMNGASAAGAMQFITGTWSAYADAYKQATIDRGSVDYPYQYSPHPDRWDDFDSIYAAAAYFHAMGVGPELDDKTYQALVSYKGTPPASIPFARHDYDRAKELEAAAAQEGGAGGDVSVPPGSRLERVVNAANAIQARKFPYCWSGGHGPKPGPSSGISYCWGADGAQHPHGSDIGLDCSGSTRLLLVLAGYSDPGPIGSESFGIYPSGPGKHVSIYYNAEHVFVTINGRAWTTSVANYRHGPGWAPHTIVGFAVSHPPGL